MLEEIYIQRRRIANDIQPFKHDSISKLDDVLQSFTGINNPYESFDDFQYKELYKCCSEFEKGASCTKLKANTSSAYLYRYTPIRKLIGGKDSTWDRALIDSDDAFKFLLDACKDDEWFKLSTVMTGTYKNPRGFSWWTCNEINTLENLFKLGLVTNWVDIESVIMRIKITTAIKHRLNVPSVIDAFAQPIFYPKALGANSGITLNLNDLIKFENGNTEYVIGEVDISDIEIFPIDIDIVKNQILLENILKDLHMYYKAH